MSLCVLLLFLFAISQEGMAKPDTTTGSCEEIQIPLCKDLHYNHTLMPNSVGHKNQQDAALQANTFAPLVQYQCSPALKPFLCSVYAPECKSGRVSAPCKSTCMVVKRDCYPVLIEFGFEWPTFLNCDLFSEDSCEKGTNATLQKNIKITDLPYLMERKDIADHDKALSPATWRTLFLYSDKDGSGDLSGEEYEELKIHLSVLRHQFTERWQFGRQNHQSFQRILKHRGMNLIKKTTEALWNISSIGKEEYDEFVATLTKLDTLKGRFDSKVLTLPCDCKIAGFTFDEFIMSSVL